MDIVDSFKEIQPGVRNIGSDGFPTSVRTWQGQIFLPDSGTHFGFVQSGPATLQCDTGCFILKSGMYFAIPGRLSISGGAGLLITAHHYNGFFQIGGPIEPIGRLRYIDGCTDSLLISPAILGDPCLNLLHIPANTQQTAHTHPSFRVGMIVSGTGECVTPTARYPLHPGLSFIIPENSEHSFHTTHDNLTVIAYHPDSDYGPTHEFHPMVNKTILRETA